tara:strand:+ start:8478 stop:8606 length:129 start_codon:yes stop_codon:yes gene_type:complete
VGREGYVTPTYRSLDPDIPQAGDNGGNGAERKYEDDDVHFLT